MNMPATIKAASRLAAITALALVGMAATSIETSALPNCPGGGTRKCTIKCTGPVLKPVCVETEPCTCAITDKKGSAAAQRNPGARNPTSKVPTGVRAPQGSVKSTSPSRGSGFKGERK